MKWQNINNISTNVKTKVSLHTPFFGRLAFLASDFILFCPLVALVSRIGTLGPRTPPWCCCRRCGRSWLGGRRQGWALWSRAGGPSWRCPGGRLSSRYGGCFCSWSGGDVWLARPHDWQPHTDKAPVPPQDDAAICPDQILSAGKSFDDSPWNNPAFRESILDGDRCAYCEGSERLGPSIVVG